MLFGIIGCIGAWFEKKALLFIVIQSFSFDLSNLSFIIVYYSNGSNLYWIISWYCINYCFK
jgi:hypothetical protein